MNHASYLVVHQNSPLTLAVFQDPPGEFGAKPPTRREAYGPCCVFGIPVRLAHSLVRGEIHTEPILPLLAQLDHFPTLWIIGLDTRIPSIAELVIRKTIIT
jgi:hypothetical protein